VYRTGDIGLFKITSEGGVASGIRRIEAVTAQGAIEHIQNTENKMIAVKDAIKANDSNLFDKLTSLQELLKSQEKEIAKLKKDLLSGSNSTIKELEHNGITIVVANIDGVDVKTLRDKIDDYKSSKTNVVVVLSTVVAGKVAFVIGVSKSIIAQVKAGDIAQELSSYIDGKGGGRPDMAQGGGNNTANIEEALSKTEKFIIDSIN
jgi:alanyl-tRNA synthetase